MNNLEKRVAAIESRNKKVSQDKAWETSWTRRFSITVLTYVILATYLAIIGNDKPFINACVPAIGYLLSTLVMSRIRNLWQK